MSEPDRPPRQEDQRLREHPTDRFAPPAQAFDLDTAARELAAEPAPASQPQRQKTLYRHGNATLAMFLFEAGAAMKEHTAMGTVFVHVLAGRLTVQARGQRHDLPAGRVLVMEPGVPHDVYAEERTRMLLTVCMQAAGPEGSS